MEKNGMTILLWNMEDNLLYLVKNTVLYLKDAFKNVLGGTEI